MTVLFLSRLFYPHIGGVEKHVYEVAKQLTQNGYTILVITEKFSEELKENGKHKNIHFFRIPIGKDNWFKKFKIWGWLWRNRDLIKKANIVHCHDVFFWYLPFRFLYWKKPVYTTFHGYEGKFPPSKKSIVIRKLSEKLSSGNICIGKFIEKWYGTKANYVLYGAVNSVEDKNIMRSHALKILLLGRLENDIGIVNYLKALQILRDKKIKFQFEACGDGFLRIEVEKYGKVLGFVDDPYKHVQEADVILASSYLIILEAFSYKKLVIATYDNPLKEDYLKMTPFAKYMVIAENPKMLVEKITYYRQNLEEKETLIENAYEWVKKQTWKKVMDTYLTLWNI